MFIAQQRAELYGMIDFIANMGGLLGLFTGVSIISFIEIVYFVFRGSKLLRTRPKSDENLSSN